MRYQDLTSPEIDALDREATVLLLPIGAVEQHGEHMPVGTDTMLAEALCLAAAGRRPGTLVLPPPWYGYSPHHMRFAGSITLGAETLLAVVGDVVGSVVRHGFRRLVIVNGHGGNASLVGVMAATLGERHYGAARIAGVTYFQLAAAAIAGRRRSGAGGMGHACEFETSLMLHVAPELVRVEKAAATYPDPGSAYLSTDLVAGTAVRTYLDFADLSASGTLGDPTLASAAQGAGFFEDCAAALTAFVADFGGWPVERGG